MENLTLEELFQQKRELNETIEELNRELKGESNEEVEEALKELNDTLEILEEMIRLKKSQFTQDAILNSIGAVPQLPKTPAVSTNPYLGATNGTSAAPSTANVNVSNNNNNNTQTLNPKSAISLAASEFDALMENDFEPSTSFSKTKLGFVFKTGPQGLGYYKDSAMERKWYFKFQVPGWNSTHEKLLKTGIVCSAQYAEDSKWYDASIDWFDSKECKWQVTFIGYGNSQLCTATQIKYLSDSSKPKKRDMTGTELNNDTTVVPQTSASDFSKKEFVVPPSLKVLPTDSEEIKQEKKRRLNSLKSQFRLKRLEDERSAKKNAWQDFNNKKKAKVGFITGRKKESIFASPNTVEGKVGVTGSGKAPTPIQTKPTAIQTRQVKLSTPFDLNE